MPTVALNVREPPEHIEGLDDLLADLRDDLGRDYEVILDFNPYEGRAVTWGQLFNFMVDEATQETIGLVIGAFVAWGVKVLRRERDEKGHVNPRPRIATIYDRHGRPLKQVKVNDPDKPPEDTTEELKETTRMIEAAKRRAEGKRST